MPAPPSRGQSEWTVRPGRLLRHHPLRASMLDHLYGIACCGVVSNGMVWSISIQCGCHARLGDLISNICAYGCYMAGGLPLSRSIKQRSNRSTLCCSWVQGLGFRVSSYMSTVLHACRHYCITASSPGLYIYEDSTCVIREWHLCKQS